MDAVALIKKYGKQLRLVGNIDKRALIQSKDDIKKEVDSKLPFLIKDLGYIPSVDHCILKHFKYYVNLIKDYIKENLARYLQQLRRELKMEKLNIALIGCGGIANALLKVIKITSIPSHNG